MRGEGAHSAPLYVWPCMAYPILRLRRSLRRTKQRHLALQEIVVTAQRREQSLESVPYSISVVSGNQLSDAGVTDIASLTSQVPGLSIYDLGTRLSGAVFPIIRGINASATTEDRPFSYF